MGRRQGAAAQRRSGLSLWLWPSPEEQRGQRVPALRFRVRSAVTLKVNVSVRLSEWLGRNRRQK